MNLKQSEFDAHGLTQGCPWCRAMREGIRAQGRLVVCRERLEELLQGRAKGRQRLQEAERRTRDTACERTAKRIMLQFADRPVNPVSSSSAANLVSSSSARSSDTVAAGDGASNVFVGIVAQVTVVQDLSTRLQGCGSKCGSRHRDVGRG